MSLKEVTRYEEAPICDYCDEEVRYYSDRHVRADVIDIMKNNNQNSPNTITPKTHWVTWWRPKPVVFGNDRFDFHGECFIKLMSRLDELKGNK